MRPPRRWAALVATGPASLALVFVTGFVYGFGVPQAAPALGFSMWLGALSPALVAAGVWLDMRLTSPGTPLGRRALWAAGGFVLAPVVGLAYLVKRDAGPA